MTSERADALLHSAASLAASALAAAMGLTTILLLKKSADGVAADWAILTTTSAAMAAMVTGPYYLEQLASGGTRRGPSPAFVPAMIAVASSIVLSGRWQLALAVLAASLTVVRIGANAVSAQERAQGNYLAASITQGPTLLGAAGAAAAAFMFGEAPGALYAVATCAVCGAAALGGWRLFGQMLSPRSEVQWWRSRANLALATSGYSVVVASTDTWALLPQLSPVEADEIALLLRVLSASDILLGALSVSGPPLLAAYIRDRSGTLDTMRQVSALGTAIFATPGAILAAAAALSGSGLLAVGSASLLSRAALIAAGPAAIGLALLGSYQETIVLALGSYLIKAAALALGARAGLHPYLLIVLSAGHVATVSLLLGWRLASRLDTRVIALPSDLAFAFRYQRS